MGRTRAKLPYREASAASALEPNEGIAWGNLMLKVLKVEVMVEMNVRGQISTDITLHSGSCLSGVTI